MYRCILVIFLRSVFTSEQSHFEIISIISVFRTDSCHERIFQDQEKAGKSKKNTKQTKNKQISKKKKKKREKNNNKKNNNAKNKKTKRNKTSKATNRQVLQEQRVRSRKNTVSL